MIDIGVDIVERARPDKSPEDKVAGRTSVNLLTHNRPFTAAGRTATVSCTPEELQFKGFVPGQPQEQVVKLCNVSGAFTRIMVVPPTTPHFKIVARQPCGGDIAPGLSQQLVVQFTGSELRHYTDCIHVHTMDGGLLVPLHAYPVMSSKPLPSHIDLGDCELGHSSTTELQLVCDTGVAFDYHVTILQHNKRFSVTPLTGTVSPYGTAAVSITFTPARYSTEHMKMRVLLLEYGGQPVEHLLVLVTGSARPGLVQEHVLAAGQQQLLQALPDAAVAPAAAASSEQVAGCMHTHRGQPADTRRSPDGAQHGSATDLQGSSSSGKSIRSGMPLSKACRVTQHDVNSLLNQRPGRLQIKDIKGGAGCGAAAPAGSTGCWGSMWQGPAGPATPVTRCQGSIVPDAAAAGCSGRAALHGPCHRRGGGAALGSTPPTPDELQHMVQARQALLQQAEVQKQQAATHRLQLSMQTAGATHILPEALPGGSTSTSAVGSQSGAIAAAIAYPSTGDPSTSSHAVDSTSTSDSSGGSSRCDGVGSSYTGLEGFRPQWLLLSEGNAWRKRVQVVQRFVHAARVVMYRNRANARLRKLKALAVHLKGSRDSLAGGALQELLLEGGSIIRRPGLAPAQLMRPDKVQPSDLPPTAPEGCRQHKEEALGVYSDYSSLQVQPYKAEFEYVLLGYQPEEYPGLLPYVPLCESQPLLSCALEDDWSVRLAYGVLPEGLASDVDAMPQGLSATPYASCSVPPRDQVCASLSPAWGIEPEVLLQPRTYIPFNSLLELPGTDAIKALAPVGC